MLLALERGETRTCRVVRVPSPAEEDARRQHRERQVLVAERTRHGNRITGLLMALGIRGVNPRCRDFVAHLQTLRTGDDEPLPLHTKQALTREHERLCLIERQIREIEATQAAAVKAAETTARQPEAGGAEGSVGRAALLVRLKGVGPIGAMVLSHEVFYRHFGNRREVASYFGLTPSPYNSGGMHSDQGIGKAGNPRARTLAIELAWLWVRHQPASVLAKWFVERAGSATGRIRRIAIVALARKLMVALWRYLTTGMIPEGAVMKPA
jgi:transposase